MNKKALVNVFITFAFFIAFLYFSMLSLIDYIHGETVFDVINDHDENLLFPSVTVCPKTKKDNLVYLDLDKYLKIMNGTVTPFSLSSYFVFQRLRNMADPFGFVKENVSKYIKLLSHPQRKINIEMVNRLYYCKSPLGCWTQIS